MASTGDILKTIQDAVDKLSESAAAKQNPLFRELINLIQKLETKNNAILNNISNLRLINDIKNKLEKLIIDDKYKEQIKQFAQAFDQVAQLQNQYFAQFAAKFKPPSAIKVLTKSAIETTITNLTETGVQAGVTEGMRKILLTNMQNGGSMADLADQLREYMVNTDNTGDGALLKYVKAYATTAINQYSAEYNKQIADDLGLEWYMYTGSLLTTSRPFCVKAVHKHWIHQSEFEALLHGDFGDQGHVALTKSTGLPAGMMEGTDVENFPRRRGGWNCGHQLIAVDDTVVPPDIRDKVYATTAYKTWAAKNGKKIRKPSFEKAA